MSAQCQETQPQPSGNILSTQQHLYITEPFGDDYSAFGIQAVVAEAQTRFQHVQIVDTFSYGRALYLDGAIQSAEYDEYIYHEALIHPALANLNEAAHVLILGGGEGASAREVLRYPDVESVDMVDIDGELINLCKAHLPDWSDGAFEDERLTVHVQDAIAFVNQMDKTYDLIILDLIDEFSSNSKNELVELLYSDAVFARLKQHLNPEGALVIQCSEFNQGEFDSFAHLYRKVSPLFRFAEIYTTFVPSFTSAWGFMVCNHHQSFAALTVETVDANILEQLVLNAQEDGEPAETLTFYDGLTHQGMFALPKDLRQLVANDFIETEESPELL